MLKPVRIVWIVCLASLALAGCASPEKAETLKSAVVQFSIEADAAILAIDEMRRREIEPAPRTDTEATSEFVANVLEVRGADGTFNPDEITLLVEPYDVDLSPAAEKAWTDLIAKLRGQYLEFANAFDRLPQGSLFAAKPVAQSAEPARKLTQQLAAFAVNIDANPPKLLQHRADLATRLNAVPAEEGATEAERQQVREQIALLRERALRVLRDERELKRSVVEKLVRASTLGNRVTRLIDAYDDISIQDLQFLVNQSLEIAGAVTGEDYSKIRTRAQDIVNDPTFNAGITAVLTEINAARPQPQAASQAGEDGGTQ